MTQKSSEDAEVAILKRSMRNFRMQLKALTPKDAASGAEYKRVVGGGWECSHRTESPNHRDGSNSKP